MSDFVPVVSIVVPVLNQADKTIKCFQSIRASTKTPYEIVWVDNGSKAEHFGPIKHAATRPRMHTKLIRNSENLGFVRATNQGIREARGEFIILLNNDTEVTEGWEIALLKPLRNNPEVGAVGPVTQSKIAWQEARKLNYLWDLGVPAYNTTPAAYARLLHEKFINKYIDVGTHPLSFFCVAIKKATFNELGLLHTGFSIGLGDDDEYCARLRAAKYKLMLSLGTFVYHHHRTTFSDLKIGVDSVRRHNITVLKKRIREMAAGKIKVDPIEEINATDPGKTFKKTIA